MPSYANGPMKGVSLYASITLSSQILSFRLIPVEARTVLWYMTFIGFIVNYMLRINLNITIVDMIAGVNGRTTLAPPTNATINALVTNKSDFLASVAPVVATANNTDRVERYSWERQFLDWAKVSMSGRVGRRLIEWLRDAYVTHREIFNLQLV